MATISIPVWALTSYLGKVTYANRVLEATGGAWAFSLDLGPKEIAAAHAHRKGFTDYFRRRISRELKPLGYAGRFWFGVHVIGGRLHVHGGLAANENDRDIVDAALCRAGGRWANTRHADKQCKLKPQPDPDGWVHYALLDQAKARRLIRGKANCISNPLRRAAKARYEADRARMIISNSVIRASLKSVMTV